MSSSECISFNETITAVQICLPSIITLLSPHNCTDGAIQTELQGLLIFLKGVLFQLIPKGWIIVIIFIVLAFAATGTLGIFVMALNFFCFLKKCITSPPRKVEKVKDDVDSTYKLIAENTDKDLEKIDEELKALKEEEEKDEKKNLK